MSCVVGPESVARPATSVLSASRRWVGRDLETGAEHRVCIRIGTSADWIDVVGDWCYRSANQRSPIKSGARGDNLDTERPCQDEEPVYSPYPSTPFIHKVSDCDDSVPRA